MRFVLVHSPLVGPTTWRFVAEALEGRGHEVLVPDLRAAAQSGDPHAFIAAARSAVNSDTSVVVGHSGAGFFLPLMVAATPVPARLVFVDAALPPCAGTVTASADFIDELRSLAVNGRLPRWSNWWGDGVIERLVPDDRRRAAIEVELPELPLAFYETPVSLPDGWCDAPAGFVLLSVSYRPDATTAEAHGWPTIELLGAHLDIVNRPDAIAQALTGLVGESA